VTLCYNLYGKFYFLDSTISHVGFILLALAISTEQSIESLIFYIIQYTITNLNSFLILIALSYIFYNTIINNKINKENNNSKIQKENNNKIINFSDINYISEFKGQFSINPLLTLSLSICLFSMAGIPVKNFRKILQWDKLSNSGDFLKLLIPNYN
jgi:NADH-ubiquinone oxidoreductase chain 2